VLGLILGDKVFSDDRCASLGCSEEPICTETGTPGIQVLHFVSFVGICAWFSLQLARFIGSELRLPAVYRSMLWGPRRNLRLVFSTAREVYQIRAEIASRVQFDALGAA